MTAVILSGFFTGAAFSWPVPHKSLYFNSRLVGMTSKDPNLLYLMPMHWSVQRGQHYFEKISDDEYTLGIIVKPDFSRQIGLVTALLGSSLPTLVVPLPVSYIDSELYLSDSLGKILVRPEREPVNDFSRMLYYKIKFSGHDIAVLRSLAEHKLPLLGTVRYRVETVEGVEEYEVGMSIPLYPEMLKEKKRTQSYDMEWLKDLMRDHEMVLHNIVDSSYSLGGFFRVHLDDSVLRVRIKTGCSTFRRKGGSVQCGSKGQEGNLSGSLSFLIREPGFQVKTEFKGELDLSIDLMSLKTQISGLRIREISGPGGELSPVYRRVISDMMDSKEFKNKLSEALSRELENRIMNQNLFI